MNMQTTAHRSKGASAMVMMLLAALAPGAVAAKAPPRLVRAHPKDPPPLLTSGYLDIGVSLHRGKIKVDRVERGSFGEARAITRFRGRYEIRLYGGRLLRDVVRFSFPLTLPAGERTSPNIRLDRALAHGVRARTTVRVPFAGGIDRVLLLDTRLGHRLAVNLRGVLAPPMRPELAAPGRTSIFSPDRDRKPKPPPGQRPASSP